MIRLIFIFALALFITLFTMWKVEASPPVPEIGQLVRPPYVIQYQQENHAVFDYGGLEFLYVVTRMPTRWRGNMMDYLSKILNYLAMNIGKNRNMDDI